MIRLNKHLARLTGISRREADDLISSGKVTVDGKTATLGQQPTSTATILVNGKQIASDSPPQYVALNKPIGYVCSRKQQGENPTIYSLLPKELQQLKTVGRLDRDSSGIILLTNDGDFAHQMTHPSFSKTKIYEVELDKPLQPLHQQMISDHGIQLDDGVSRFTVEKIVSDRLLLSDEETKGKVQRASANEMVSEYDEKQRGLGRVYRITMSEGRNRQIRRTFAALGYEITKLHRIQFGNFKLDKHTEGKHWNINL